jgi:putative ABC transport system permease protein
MHDWSDIVRPHLAALQIDPAREAEIVDEISQHLDQRYAELRARGATEEEARRVVIEDLREPDALSMQMSRLRQAHAPPPITPSTAGSRMLGGLWRDLHIAVRTLRKTPVFTAAAVMTLALAIGTNAAIFTLVDTVLLDPLPYPNADRLVVIKGSAPGTDFAPEFNLAPEFLIEFQEQADLLENVASYRFNTYTLRAGERSERVWMSMPSLSLFETLGVTPELGRLPTPEEGAQAAVISDRTWRDWFGGDPNVIGRSYSIAGAMRTVVGVMPPEFAFPSEDVAVWFPSTFDADGPITPGQFGLPLVARVRPGVEEAALLAQLDVIAGRLPEQYGGGAAYSRIIDRLHSRVVPLEQELLGPLEAPLWILLGAMSILLVIACANVANLFLARGERQRRELAIRRAIGAPLGALIRRQLGETMIVAVLGGALAVGVAALMLPVIVTQGQSLASGPFAVPRLNDAELSATTLLFTFAISVVAGLACGVMPAARAAGANLAWLRDASRGVTRRRHWTRDSLVVAQAALALLLIVGSGLLLRSFVELRNVDPGYVTKDIFTFQMAPDRPQFDGRSWSTFHHAFMERLRGLPGVEKVGIVEAFPLTEFPWTQRFTLDAQPGGAPASEQSLNMTFTAGDYFEAMGIELVRGRTFTQSEQQQNPGHIVVSRSTAQRLWPGEDPIGKQITLNSFGFRETVIGVVEDVRQLDVRNESGPDIYFPLVAQQPERWALSSPGYAVRASRAAGIEPEVRALLREVAPEAPMYQVHTIEGLVADSMAELSFTMIALALASGLALFLGMVGLYGILSSAVAERRREIGIRIALGAAPQRVRRMVVAQGLRVVSFGVLAGLVGAVLSVRVLEGLLYGVAPLDTATLAVTSLLMLIVGVAASWIPAYRASSVDPVETLAES